MDIRGLLAAERAELVELLRTLTDEQWEAPSLCGGWRVREVVGHMLHDTIALSTYTAICVRHGLRVNRVNDSLAAKAASLPPAAMVDRLEATAGTLSKWMPRVILADMLVHQQDIRRPLGLPRDIPADRLTAALDHPDPLASPWRYTRGLRFVATDIPWARGSGPEVRGTGEALALAVVGRSVVLDELEGDGVPELRRRCG